MKAGYHDIPTATVVTETLNNDPKGGYNTISNEEVTWEKGQVQPPAYRDYWFGFVFWAQILTFVVFGALFSVGYLETDFEESRRSLEEAEFTLDDVDFKPFALAVLCSFLIAPTLTVFAFSFMFSHAEGLIAASLIFTIGFNLAVAIACILKGVPMVSIVFFVMAATTGCYAMFIWKRIPYAGTFKILAF